VQAIHRPLHVRLLAKLTVILLPVGLRSAAETGKMYRRNWSFSVPIGLPLRLTVAPIFTLSNTSKTSLALLALLALPPVPALGVAASIAVGVQSFGRAKSLV